MMAQVLVDSGDALAELASGQARIKGFDDVEGLVLPQPAVMETAKDLLIQLGETGNGPEDSRSTESMSPPVQAEVADNRPEPRGKRRGPPGVKLANSPEIVSFEPLADKDEAILDPVVIALEEMDDLENQRGVPVQELIPRFFVVLREESRKPVGDTRIEPHPKPGPVIPRQPSVLQTLSEQETPEPSLSSLLAGQPCSSIYQCMPLSGGSQTTQQNRAVFLRLFRRALGLQSVAGADCE